jgi:hypothetical protein
MTDQVHALDVASYQGRDLSAFIRAYQPEHVVVHLYMPSEGPGPQFSRDQILCARDHGCTVGGYVFVYRPGDSVDYYLANTLELCASVGLELPICWIDCEPSVYGPGPDERWMDEWLVKAGSVGMQTGLYCNLDWFNTHPGFAKYADVLPLWLAHYDGVADVTSGPIPAGWSELAAKQWQVSDDGIGQIDRDVFRREFTVYGTPSPPVPDACSGIRDGLLTLINRKPFRVKRRELEALLG